MTTQNLTNTMICWNPGGAVALVPWPDRAGASDRFEMSGGACYGEVKRASFEQRKAMAFIEAMHLIVRDGCDPAEVNRVLMGLEEYRAGCSGDMPDLPPADKAKRSPW